MPSLGVLTIDTTAKQVVLQQTVKMLLDRTSGDLTMIWRENSVRDHRRPSAIRASKVRLRDEKSSRAVCMPVRQRTF